MNIFFVTVYLFCFAVIAGAAFAMMWSNVSSVNKEMSKPRRIRHPEAPEPGDEVMFVDFSKERLERIYNGEQK